MKWKPSFLVASIRVTTRTKNVYERNQQIAWRPDLTQAESLSNIQNDFIILSAVQRRRAEKKTKMPKKNIYILIHIERRVLLTFVCVYVVRVAYATRNTNEDEIKMAIKKINSICFYCSEYYFV